MLLAIDVGNTNIVLGVFDGDRLVQSWRLQTLRERTSDELGLLVDGLFAHGKIDKSKIHGVILGSVVPPLTGTFKTMVARYFGVPAVNIEPGTDTGMPILYENPAEVGADRIVNGVGGLGTIRTRQGPPDDRGRFRNGDDARRDQREGRVSRRRDLSRRADFRGRALSARGAAAAYRRAQAVRASSAGRRSARWNPGSSSVTSGWSRVWSSGCRRNSAATRSAWPRAGSPTSSHRKSRKSSTSIRT